jgi:hypothetical protein
MEMQTFVQLVFWNTEQYKQQQKYIFIPPTQKMFVLNKTITNTVQMANYNQPIIKVCVSFSGASVVALSL